MNKCIQPLKGGNDGWAGGKERWWKEGKGGGREDWVDGRKEGWFYGLVGGIFINRLKKCYAMLIPDKTESYAGL